MSRVGDRIRDPSADLLGALFAGGLILGAIAVRWAWADGVKAPQILCDEFFYSGIARSVEQGQGFTFRGVPLAFSYVYPLMIAPAWALSPMERTYEAAKAVNVVAMSLTAVPVYLWARRLVSPAWSVLACFLVLLMPAFAFTGLVMTENAALPAFVLGAFGVAYALERRTPTAQVLALAALALACVTRYQNAVLLPVFVAGALLELLFAWRAGMARRELRRRALLHARPVAVMALAVAGYLAYKRVQTGRFATALGPYDALAHGSYPVQGVVHWSLLHAGELVLTAAVLPACALVLLLGLGIAGDLSRDAERAFVAVAVAAVVLVTIQIGAFATDVADFVVERYTFYVVPLILLAFVVWLGKGLPRPRIAAAAAAVVPVVGLLWLVSTFRSHLFEAGLPVNTLTLFAVTRLPLRLGGSETRAAEVLVAGALIAGLAFLATPRRVARVVFPVAVAAALFAAARPVSGATIGQSRDAAALAGPNAAWIDETIGANASAAFLITPSADVYSSSGAILQTEFWNRSVRSVIRLGGAEICELPSQVAAVDDATGRIEVVSGTEHTPVRNAYVVVQRGVAVTGDPLAEGGTTVLPLALYRVRAPLRIESVVEGVQGDGWMSSKASYSRYAAPPGKGHVDVGLSRTAWTGPDKPGLVRIRIGRLARSAKGEAVVVDPKVVRWTIHSGGSRTFSLRAPPPPFRVEVHIDPTFSPADYGQPDTRRLGAQVTFAYR